MVVETESAFRQQTLRHFVHTFIRNHDRESAADRTMRSRYVPRSIKIQLLAAIRECKGDDKNCSAKISNIAYMGLFVDTSCNEIVFYHSVVSTVLQWTASLYVRDTRVQNFIGTILDDMGRIGEDDVRFILEKYRYMEEQKAAGLLSDQLNVDGLDRMLSFLRPRSFDPAASYISYYTRSLMLKLAKSLLRNSGVFFNTGDLFSVSGGGSIHSDSSDEDDRFTPEKRDNRLLYRDYKRQRERLATIVETESLERIDTALKRGTVNEHGFSETEPPEVINTVFDQFDCSEWEDGQADSEDSLRDDCTELGDVPRTEHGDDFVRRPATVKKVVSLTTNDSPLHGAFSYRTSPVENVVRNVHVDQLLWNETPSREDLEVEEILRSLASESSDNSNTVKNYSSVPDHYGSIVPYSDSLATLATVELNSENKRLRSAVLETTSHVGDTGEHYTRVTDLALFGTVKPESHATVTEKKTITEIKFDENFGRLLSHEQRHRHIYRNTSLVNANTTTSVQEAFMKFHTAKFKLNGRATPPELGSERFRVQPLITRPERKDGSINFHQYGLPIRRSSSDSSTESELD